LLLLGSIAVVYPLGYCFYYGNYLIIGGKDLYGPHYYLGLLIPATILLAVAVVDLGRRRAAYAVLVVVALLAGTGIEAGDKIRRNQRVRDDVAREVNAVHDTVRGRALVVVPHGPDGAYVLHPRGAMGNSPDLAGSTLYAADLGGRNLELFDRFPDRAVYQFQTISDGTSRPGRPEVELLRRNKGTSFDLVVHATPLPGRSAFVTYAAVEGEVDRVCVVDRDARPERPIAAPVRITASAVTLSGCDGGDVTVPVPPGPSTLVIGAASSLEPELATGSQVESRYWARSTGTDLELVTPPETWRWDPGDDFAMVDAASVGWVTFDLAAP
jgi:hypothetical protein